MFRTPEFKKDTLRRKITKNKRDVERENKMDTNRITLIKIKGLIKTGFRLSRLDGPILILLKKKFGSTLF